MSKEISSFLIPNVSKLPNHQKVESRGQENTDSGEFRQLLQEQIGDVRQNHGIKLSIHAAKRLNERNMGMDSQEFFKIKDAMNKLKEKGGQDSLIVTSKGAYIVDVANNTIVTAIDKENIKESVFTKIDSTVIVN